MRELTFEELQGCEGGVGSGWFDYSVTKNDAGCYQVDINALDGGLIRYEWCPQPKQVTTTEFSVSWSLKDRTLTIPRVTEGEANTGLTRTYYPPTADGAYQAYRDGERFFY